MLLAFEATKEGKLDRCFAPPPIPSSINATSGDDPSSHVFVAIPMAGFISATSDKECGQAAFLIKTRTDFVQRHASTRY